jgi:hypothetical protein
VAAAGPGATLLKQLAAVDRELWAVRAAAAARGEQAAADGGEAVRGGRAGGRAGAGARAVACRGGARLRTDT